MVTEAAGAAVDLASGRMMLRDPQNRPRRPFVDAILSRPIDFRTLAGGNWGGDPMDTQNTTLDDDVCTQSDDIDPMNLEADLDADTIERLMKLLEDKIPGLKPHLRRNAHHANS